MQHSKIISGIDIGTSKITTIISQYLEAEDRLNVVAVASIPALGFKKGQIINLEQAGKSITQSIESAERMAGFQISHAYISIAAAYIESINSQGVVAVSGPNGEIDNVDIERAIEASKSITLPQGKEIIHIIPKKFTVDGQDGIVNPVGMNGVRLEVETHIIIASSPAIKNLKKCIDEIGIKTETLIYSGISTSSAALSETEKELGVCQIDIGGSVTTITVFNENSPIYSSVIPIGANNVTNDLAIGLRYSLDVAEKIKLKLPKMIENKKFEDEIDLPHFGIVLNSNEIKTMSIQTAINGIVRPRLEEMFNIINDLLTSNGIIRLIPAGIVLTGGGSQTINAKEICEKTIQLPVRVASPPKIGGIIDDIMNPAYTSAIGLLLYGHNESKKDPKKITSKKVSFQGLGLLSKVKHLLSPLLP